MTSSGRGQEPVLAAFEARFTNQLSPTSIDRTTAVLNSELAHVMTRNDSGRDSTYRRYEPGPVAEYVTDDRAAALTISSSFFRLEVGLYRGLEHFRDLVAQVAGPLVAAGTVESVSRIGLRKVEELTLPWAGREAHEWDGYISQSLLAPLGLIPPAGSRERLSGRLMFEVNQGHLMSLSYGTSPRPTLRMSPARLRLPRRRTPGGVFMLDADSYLLEDVPASERAMIESISVLDRPIVELFNRCVTGAYRRLREEQASLFDVASDSE